MTKDSLIINKNNYDSGYVKFNLFKPNDDKTDINILNEYECTQEDFIVFLQSGILRTTNKKEIKLY